MIRSRLELILALTIGCLVVFIVALLLIPAGRRAVGLPAISSSANNPVRSTRSTSNKQLGLFRDPPTSASQLEILPTAEITHTVGDIDWVESRLKEMSLSQKIGQMLLVGLDRDASIVQACYLIKTLAPGGIYYPVSKRFTAEQLQNYSAGLQACARSSVNVPLYFAIENDGEFVKRFHNGLTMFPEQIAQGATGEPKYAYLTAFATGQELGYSGVNMILDPVADITIDYDKRGSTPNTFGADPTKVGQYVAQSVTGYRDSHMISVISNFPGLTGAAEGTIRQIPADQVDRKTLVTSYLPPFQKGLEAGAPVMMLSKIAYPAITGEILPAAISEPIIQFLRNDLKFKGMILSDISEVRTPDGAAMEIPQAAALAIKAGSDMVLVTDPSAAPAAYQRLLAAVEDGEISAERVDDAVRQILTIKAAYGLKDFTLPQVPEPDWNGNAELARQTALDAVTLLRDNEKLIPLAANQNILIVGPDRNWSFYQKLSEALFEHHITPKFDFYSNPYFGQPQETQYLTSIPQEAPHYDVTLVFTWNAHLNNIVFNNPWQIQLIQNIQKSTSNLIVVALKSPTDYLDLPEVSTFLATYGTNDYLMDALIKILTGDYQPTAQFPLSVSP